MALQHSKAPRSTQVGSMIITTVLTVIFPVIAVLLHFQPQPVLALTAPKCPAALFTIPHPGAMGWPYKDPAARSEDKQPDGSPVISHTGIDIFGQPGDPVYAAYDGVVSSRQGSYIVITHNSLSDPTTGSPGIDTFYTHLTGFTVNVGQNIGQGQVIGYLDSSGEDHVHFSIKKKNRDERILGDTFDPSTYLGANVNYENGARAYNHSVLDRCYETVLFNSQNYNDSTGALRIKNQVTAYNIPAAFNNTASSIQVPQGWSVTVFENQEGRGGKKTFQSSDPDLSNDTFDNGVNINDQISSITITFTPGCYPTVAVKTEATTQCIPGDEPTPTPPPPRMVYRS